MNPTLFAHTLAAKIPEMARDSVGNNSAFIESLLIQEIQRSRILRLHEMKDEVLRHWVKSLDGVAPQGIKAG